MLFTGLFVIVAGLGWGRAVHPSVFQSGAARMAPAPPAAEAIRTGPARPGDLGTTETCGKVGEPAWMMRELSPELELRF